MLDKITLSNWENLKLLAFAIVGLIKKCGPFIFLFFLYNYISNKLLK